MNFAPKIRRKASETPPTLRPKKNCMTSPRLSLLTRALRGEKTEATPVWYMRQAGRYLPEYNEIRRGLSFTELCADVDRAVRVSLQPYERFGVDGVIMFSDILTPLAGAGVPLHFEEKRGPILERTVESAADLALLDRFDPERDVPFVGAILKRLRAALDNLANGSSEVRSTPVQAELYAKRGRPALLGFAGAPFTLASYLIEGGTSKKFEKTKGFVFGKSDLFLRLSERLAEITIEYLCFQLESGADAVQIFDSWGGVLSPRDYREFSAPFTARIIEGVRKRFDRPIILFTGNGAHLLPEMIAQKPSAISLDWRVSAAEALRVVPEYIALQGNLDPLILYGTAQRTADETRHILNGFGERPGYVFNLGHGIHPQTPIENVETMLAEVRAFRGA